MSTAASGLRERKKQRTREAIQDHALRLYQEQGYAATTTEQIAAAAEVSPSTFFRYFPTKPDTVLYDRLDPVFVDALLAQPAGLPVLAATRAAMREVFSSLGDEAFSLEQTRMRLVAEVPELRAASVQQVEATVPLLAQAVATRTGRAPDDADVLHWIGAVIGVVLAAFFTAVARDEDLLEAIDRAFAFLEAGLPLEATGEGSVSGA
jgi:AcrR family transcriptional regulator